MQTPTAETIDVSTTVYPNLDLLRPFKADDTGVDAVWIFKTVYIPALFVSIFLERDLNPVKARKHLWGGIVNSGVESDYNELVD